MTQYVLNINDESLTKAIHLLKKEKLVAIPTETVYGLAALATSSSAVADIYTLKNRPAFNPLICHVSCLDEARQYGLITPLAETLAKAFWPGPLTMVVKLLPSHPLSDLVTAGLQTVGLRVPANPFVRQLIQDVGAPLAAPSANPSQHISPTLADHVRQAFYDHPKLPLILDGGPCKVGIESTILDMTPPIPELLRPGGIALEDIEALIGPVSHFTGEGIKSPGQLKRHYAPQKPLRLNVLNPLSTEAYLAFGPSFNRKRSAPTLNLSPTANLKEAACHLFSMLRLLDESEACAIAVHPIPLAGLGLGINDRLIRGAERATE